MNIEEKDFVAECWFFSKNKANPEKVPYQIREKFRTSLNGENYSILR